MNTISNEKMTIKLPFPKEIYASFKKELKISGEPKTVEEIKAIYVLAVEAFKKGDLSTDGISSICNMLFDNSSKIGGDVFQAIIAGSELGFYIRNPKLNGQFNQFLKEVLEYSEDFKKTTPLLG